MKYENISLLVGLGNPGSKYKGNRHNIGFMVLEKIAKTKEARFKLSKKIYGEITEIGFGENMQRLLMPTTYMNDSGRSIRAALDWFNLKNDQILVLVDDMDLPLGKIRIRKQGSSGGHNGLKSAIQHLGTSNFCRLRIGIGSPSHLSDERKAKTVSHVLGDFTDKELSILDQIIPEISNTLVNINTIGLEKAINKLNSIKPKNL